jgi:hypothetical protein
LVQWRDLTSYQRTCGITMLVILALGGPPAIIFAGSVEGRLRVLGGVLACLGFLLNPDQYRRPLGSYSTLSQTPPICRALILAGGVIFSLSWVPWNHL